MFTYLYEKSSVTSRFIIFMVLPIVLLINLKVGVFCGGILLVTAVMAVIVLSKRMYALYSIGCLILFVCSVMFVGAQSKEIIYQGSTFCVTLAIATFIGIEVKKFLRRFELKCKENIVLTTQLINSFVTAIDAKDHYLHNHSHNVSYYSRRIAEVLGYDKRGIEKICLAAIFHDIGKLKISRKVLSKPDKLNDEEWEMIRQHPSEGVEILENVVQLEPITDFIKYHHRYYDGNGYPQDCKMEDVPFEAFIIGVADAFDAMTSERSYRNALDVDFAYEEILKNKGIQFHPEVVDAFLSAKLEPKHIRKFEIDLETIFND